MLFRLKSATQFILDLRQLILDLTHATLSHHLQAMWQLDLSQARESARKKQEETQQLWTQHLRTQHLQTQHSQEGPATKYNETASNKKKEDSRLKVRLKTQRHAVLAVFQ